MIFLIRIKYFIQKYFTIGLICVSLILNFFFYFNGKKTGYNEREEEYQKEQKIDQEIHQERINNIEKVINESKKNKKNDYNKSGNIHNDFLLQVIE